MKTASEAEVKSICDSVLADLETGKVLKVSEQTRVVKNLGPAHLVVGGGDEETIVVASDRAEQIVQISIEYVKAQQ